MPRLLATLAAVALWSGAALAQPAGDAAAPPRQAAPGLPCAIRDGRVGRFLEQAHGRLEITAAQEDDWAAFRRDLEASTAKLAEECGRDADAPGPLPDRVAAMEARERTRLDALAGVRVAVAAFYARLDAAQRVQADHILERPPNPRAGLNLRIDRRPPPDGSGQ